MSNKEPKRKDINKLDEIPINLQNDNDDGHILRIKTNTKDQDYEEFKGF
jgi:hypothetical protein